VTTLIREWGTRSGLQAVLQVGGQTNFGPSAEALLTQFDDAPQLIVIADGDGDPEAARQRITNDLFQRAAAAEVLVVEPTLETSLGIFKPGDFSASRRRFLTSDTNRLLKLLKAGIKSRSAGDGSGAHRTSQRAVGSHPEWRLTMPLTAGLQNSRQNGGWVFLIFVADPTTVRLCNILLEAETGAPQTTPAAD
jgi:hypothetical protein